MLKRLLTGCLIVALGFLAGGWKHGYLTPAPIYTYYDTSRSVINSNLFDVEDYQMINVFQQAGGWLGPYGGSFATGSAPFYNSAYVNSAGYPVNAVSQEFGGNPRIPPSTEYSGTWCLDGFDTGSGSTFVFANDTWTTTAGVTCATGTNASGSPALTGSTAVCANNTATNSSGTITIPGTGTNGYWCIGLTHSGSTNPNFTHFSSTDGTLTAVALYESGDAARRAAGNLFRVPYLQTLVNLNPGAFRMMNWNQGCCAIESRFENRALPGFGVPISGNYWCNSLPYGALASGTGARPQYTLPSVSGTGTGCSPTGSTPVTNLHGEFITAFVPTAPTRCASLTNCQIVSITNGTTTLINTAGAVPFNDNDTVILYLQDGPFQNVTRVTGACSSKCLVNLNMYPVTVTAGSVGVGCAVSTYCFSVNYDSSGGGTYTPCSFNVNYCIAATYVSLNVNSRGAYPVIDAAGYWNMGGYSIAAALVSSRYASFVFDANSSATTDGSGNRIYGAWLSVNATGTYSASYAVPLEIQTQFVNELNALSVSQGITRPINMWITIPYLALKPNDPNYTTASDWPANAYNTIINGANGYAGLCSQCELIVENGNETWQQANNYNTNYYSRRATLLWSGLNSGGGYVDPFSTLAAIWTNEDIKNNASAYAANAARTRFDLSFQGLQGMKGGSGAGSARVYGSISSTLNYLNTEPTNPLNTNTSFSGYVIGSTLTIPSTITGTFGLGYSIFYAGLGTGNAACAVTAQLTATTWTVQGPGGSTGVQGNCGNAGSSGSPIAMTAAIAPMMIFDYLAGAPYFWTGLAESAAAATGTIASGSCTSNVATIVLNATAPSLMSSTATVGINNATGTGASNINGIFPLATWTLGTLTATFNVATCPTTITGGNINVLGNEWGDVAQGGADLTTCITAGGSLASCMPVTTYTCPVTAGSQGIAADIEQFVCDIYNAGQGIVAYQNLQLNDAIAVAIFGAASGKPKFSVNYEGGLNTNQTIYTAITNGNNFVAYLYQSTAWATAHYNYLTNYATLSNQALPSGFYIEINGNWQWACASPDTFAGGVEGAGLCPAWGTISTYDNAQAH